MASEAEQLAVKCCERHQQKIRHLHAKSSGQLDGDGVDLMLSWVMGRHGQERTYFPLTMLVQCKRSDTLETIGVVLPLPTPMIERLARAGKERMPHKEYLELASEYIQSLPRNLHRLSPRLLREVMNHYRKHPHVTCMLFVGRNEYEGKRRADHEIIEDIWRELRLMWWVVRKEFFHKVRR